MVSDSQKHKIIREFFIPDELKDDIAYCQRSLRDCVKVHQYFVERCQSLSEMQQGQVKRYLRELESEMRAIGKDQNGLVQDLATRLKHFQRKTANEKRIVLGDDLANGYVSWVLSNHCEMHCSAVPHAVSERLNETQLYQKYRLEPLLNRDATSTARPNVAKQHRESRLRKRPVLQTSLLKPKEERDLQETASNHTPSLVPSGTPLPLPPPATAAITKTATAGTAGNKRKTPPAEPIPTKMLRSRSATAVVIVKQEPEVKQEPIEQEPTVEPEQEQTPSIVIRETAAVKRGRSNLLQALNKVKTTQKTPPKQPQTSPPTSTMKASHRNNRAGSVNASETRSPSVSSESSNSRASTPVSSCQNACVPGKPNENGTSDESSNERLLPMEDEPSPLPVEVHDWDQYSYLKLFGLYTIEDSNRLKGRKNERKRRSCYSTERKDFHYGRFDCYEQQFYIVPKRRANANKRLLYTATSVEKSIKKRKPWPNGMLPPPSSLAAQDVADMKPSFPCDQLSPVIVKEEQCEQIEPDNKVCVVCNENGSVNNLSTCTECGNIYHVTCSVNGESENGAKDGTESTTVVEGCDGSDKNDNRDAVPQHETMCPVCSALAKRNEK